MQRDSAKKLSKLVDLTVRNTKTQVMNEAALTAGPTLALTKIAAAETAANALVMMDWILRIDMARFL